jgi:hypothetical protein
VISSAGQPEEQPDLKKPTALRGEVGVWDRESGDRIKGCDGACIHAEGSLAGVGGWSITNVTAFTFCCLPVVLSAINSSFWLSPQIVPVPIFNKNCE